MSSDAHPQNSRLTRLPGWLARMLPLQRGGTAPQGRQPPRKLVYAFGAVLILLVTGFALAALLAAREAALNRATHEISRITLVLAESFHHDFFGADLAASTLEQRLEQHGIGSPAVLQQVTRPREMYLTLQQIVNMATDVDALSIMDAQGQILNSSRVWPPPRTNVADRPYFRTLRDNPNPKLVIGEPVENRITGHVTTLLGRRLASPDGRFMGAILATLSVSRFEKLFAAVADSGDLQLSLYRRDGTLIARHPSAPAKPSKPDEGALRFIREAAAKGESGDIRAPAEGGESARLMSFHTVRAYPLLVQASLPQSAALPAFLRVATLISAFAIGIDIMILVIGAFLLRAWRNRLQALETEELRASKVLLRTVLDAIPHMVFVKDLRGTIRMGNQPMAAFHGLDTARIEGMETRALPGLTLEQAKILEATDQSAIRADRQERMSNVTLTGSAGKPRVFDLFKAPLRDADGKVIGLVGMREDVTEKRQAEEDLRRNRGLLENILTNVPVLVWVKDRDLKYVMVTQEFTSFYGRPASDFIGKDLFELGLVREESKLTWDQEDRDVFDHGRKIEKSLQRVLMQDGSECWQTLVKAPMRGPTGAVEYIIGAAVDITASKLAQDALKQSEDRLRQSQKMEAVGQLAGGIAHDFNNMLQVIRGYSDLVLAKLPAGGKGQREIGLVIQAADDAAALTRQLLSFSRTQASERRPVDTAELIEQQSRMLRRLIGEHIEIKVETDRPVPRIFADPAMMQQVVMNLCVNARDAMPKGGNLTIEARNLAVDAEFRVQNPWAKAQRYAVISVTDTGMGMSKEVQARIFEPFYTTKEPGKGTGLGLFTVYGIVRQHEGTVTVYSEPGVGTTFRVYLPVDETAAHADTNAAPAAAQGGKETILVAEDETRVRELVQATLESSGYTVIPARNGQEALELFRRHGDAIKLVLTDMIMPKQGGATVFREIYRANPALPIVIMTGYGGGMEDMAFIEEYKLRLLRKPYVPSELLRVVRATLDGAGTTVLGR